MERQQEGLARLLPDDVLAEVLRRLAPRDLAACRCACTAWRALVDGRRLLRADLLPLSLAGLFVSYDELPFPELFARPSSSSAAYSTPRGCVEDHCNGLLLHCECVSDPATGRLLLHHGCVSNPATGGLLPLPERPPPPRLLHYDRASNPAATGLLPAPRAGAADELVECGYLAFDPAESPDYEVFLVPTIPRYGLPRLDAATLRSAEWPPSPFRVSVLSSRTRRWEERRLVREGEPAGTVSDMLSESDGPFGFSVASRRAVCWHGALYVHQHKDFVIRISLTNHTYRVIKPPKGIEMFKYRKPHLGKSQKGVYYALTDDKWQLWASVLDESCGEWVLRHDGSQGRLLLPILNCDEQAHGPWILDNVNCNGGDINAEQVEQEFEWDSDDGETIHHTEFEDRDGKDHGFGGYIEILGFHPYKEIIFLQISSQRGLAYHLKSSKLEDLGNLYPKRYSSVDDYHLGYIEDAFPYTPCLLGEFPENMESWPISG